MTDPGLPDFFRVRQRFASQRIDDVTGAVRQSLEESDALRHVRPGHSVAVGVGSRGIQNLAEIVGVVVECVISVGGRPMIVPAMGSHGGATPEGQAGVLASYGIDPESMGCPIEPSMETFVAGKTDEGLPIHTSRTAADADHVILVNRVKPHTRLVGPLQSGLCKMLIIGLGKQAGAAEYHRTFPRYDYRFEEIARRVLPQLLKTVTVSLGLAIVEDAHEQTSHVEAVPADSFLVREPELLDQAAQHMPRLPFDAADLLIVDRIGKDISGTGLDTNVVGRKSNDKAAAADETPKIRQIYVRSLTERTGGNASGLGIAEYCHANVIRAMDVDVTRVNCLTSNHVTAAAIPVSYPSDLETLRVALTQRICRDPADVRWMRIRDTLDLAEVDCSSSFWEEANRRRDLEPLGKPRPLEFDNRGDLADTP